MEAEREGGGARGAVRLGAVQADRPGGIHVQALAEAVRGESEDVVHRPFGAGGLAHQGSDQEELGQGGGGAEDGVPGGDRPAGDPELPGEGVRGQRRHTAGERVGFVSELDLQARDGAGVVEVAVSVGRVRGEGGQRRLHRRLEASGDDQRGATSHGGEELRVSGLQTHVRGAQHVVEVVRESRRVPTGRLPAVLLRLRLRDPDGHGVLAGGRFHEDQLLLDRGRVRDRDPRGSGRRAPRGHPRQVFLRTPRGPVLAAPGPPQPQGVPGGPHRQGRRPHPTAASKSRLVRPSPMRFLSLLSTQTFFRRAKVQRRRRRHTSRPLEPVPECILHRRQRRIQRAPTRQETAQRRIAVKRIHFPITLNVYLESSNYIQWKITKSERLVSQECTAYIGTRQAWSITKDALTAITRERKHHNTMALAERPRGTNAIK